jgi:hypothetical protein
MVLTVCVVVLAFGAVGSASASAAQWYVGGSALAGSVELASTAKVVENVSLDWKGLTVQCGSGVTLTGGSIAAPNGGKVEHLVFKGCASDDGCSLTSTTIETKPLKVEAALGGKSPEDTVVLKPATGRVFAEFTLQGATCSRAGVEELTGPVTVAVTKGREELVEQEVVAHTSGEELDGWVLKGKFDVKLASGKGWSFH